MRLAHNGVITLLGVAMVSFLAGYRLRQPASTAPENARSRPLYYRDPMHPAYRSDKPGVAPDCGMQLEAVYADSLDAPAPSNRTMPGSVSISLDKQQLMGLRTVSVARRSGSYVIRALGRVTPDESRIHRITALADGVIRQVSAYTVGNMVRNDDLLATYFVSTREIYSAIQAYFVAMSALEQGAAANRDPALIDSQKAQVRLNEELLKTYGVTEAQMREMARTRQVTRDIEFRAPISGVILLRNAALGERVERGTEVFRIADLSRVWVLADLFENESSVVKPGTAARVQYRGHEFRAATSDATSQFDAASRTLKFRLELANQGVLLRPDMFVDVEFDVKEPAGISVPMDAVLDSGRRKVVFVATTPGVFEPREVRTGSHFGDRVQIVEGLQEGETVVVSGLFLLDSESRLQLAAEGRVKPPGAMGAHPRDPVCGMELDPTHTNLESEYQGATYRFCSRSCKSKFDSKPSRYVSASRGAQPRVGQP